MTNERKERLKEEYTIQLHAINGDTNSLKRYRKIKLKEIIFCSLIYIPFILLFAVFFSGLNWDKYIKSLQILSILFIVPVYIGFLISYISPILDNWGIFIGIAFLFLALVLTQILPDKIEISYFISFLLITIFSQWYSKSHKKDKLKELNDKICELQYK